MQFLKTLIAALLMSALLPVNDAVAKYKRIEAYDAKGYVCGNSVSIQSPGNYRSHAGALER
ncbi:MAG: hypothetical protein KJ725_13540 [Gammaproteobacteria bacterium]|nr:hypothetical protein [Gammaproteobacteria bacterium]